MSRCKLQYLFCVQILFGLCYAFPQNIFHTVTEEIHIQDFSEIEFVFPGIEIVYPVPPLVQTSDQAKLDVTFGSFGREQHTVLTRVEDRHLLDRATSGIFFAESDTNAYHDVKYTPRPDIFDSIGEIEFYQNTEDLSALTRFTNSTSGEVTYSGILKERYMLNDVPASFGLNFGWTTMYGYVHFINKTVSSTDQDPTVVVENSTTQTPPQNVSSPPDVVYPKILLSPSFNLTKHEKGVEYFIKELIAYMNCVDMAFRQLRDPQVHLHVSGIIIPLDESATPYIRGFPNHNFTEYNTLHYTADYFINEADRFPFNTYDIVAPLTEKYLAEIMFGHVAALASGLAQLGTVCNRAKGQLVNGGTVTVSYNFDYDGIHHMTHELGHILNANHEGVGASAECNSEGRFTMVATAYGSLRWSPCAQRSISEFLKSEEAACTYLPAVGVPESVKNTQGAWLQIVGQCQNLYKDAKGGFCLMGQPGATCQSSGCMRNGICLLNHDQSPPMEGSICAENKRCINQNCVDMP